MNTASYYENHGDNIVQPDSPDAKAAAASQNPFVCNICKRSYTRLDHLARHFRSHTNEKPFTCQTCGKSFSRVDILKRHSVNHSDDQPAKRLRTSQNGTRSRTARACNACAEAKLRCGPSRPCDRCKAKAIACEFPERLKTHESDAEMTHMRSDIILSPEHQGYPELPNSSPSRPVFNQEEMQAASSLQQMPSMQYALPQHGRSVMDDMMSISGMHHSQLPTPSTYDQGPSMPIASPLLQPDTIMPFDDLMMVDFLRDVMMPMPSAMPVQQNVPPDFTYALPQNFLDFGFDSTFDYPSMNSGPPVLLFDANPQLPASRDGEPPSYSKSGTNTPRMHQLEAIRAGQQAFNQSVWLWTPALGDHAAAEQQFLSLPDSQIMPEDQGRGTLRHTESLTLASRDRVLAMVLSTCETIVQGHVVTCFPSADFMTRAINNFFAFHQKQEYSWIHIGTLKLNEESAQVLASLFGAGAVLSKIPEVRRVGFAVQETVRTALGIQFENDNRNIRKLNLLQAYALHLDAGLWSGNRRKMEIAECFFLPLITMLRRGGRFVRPRQPEVRPDARDDGPANETKWHTWVEAESWKRLAFYFMIRDMHASMSLLVQPLISYAETSLDAPCSRDLWEATSAEEWRRLYLDQKTSSGAMPAIRTLIEDTSLVAIHQPIIDVKMTIAVVATSIWAFVWQYRQCKTIEKAHTETSSTPPSTIPGSLYDRCKLLTQHLALNAIEWDVGISAVGSLMVELCLLHIHVSLEDIQLFAGREGIDESRQALPSLRTWLDGPESRQALFHAGQIIRAARRHPAGLLRGWAAVAVYHAALTMWAWAILDDYPMQLKDPAVPPSRAISRASVGSAGKSNIFRLDVPDNPELQRFLVLGKGVPAIGAADESSGQRVLLCDPLGIMNTMQTILMTNTGDSSERSCPPLVSNLSKLMYSLGKAAAGVMKR